MRKAILLAAALIAANAAEAQTAASLFLRADSLQVNEIAAPDNSYYKKVGHHGPAVENKMMGLRIYFNDSGAIDVYSKSGKGMELLKYLWYPTASQMEDEGAGCDEYYVGKTVGLGGINLWDGEKMVRLAATGGRKARVGKTGNGHFAEMISFGVPYKGRLVDISVRVDVFDGSRDAEVTARSLDGTEVQFATGVNYHDGAGLAYGKGYIAAWGRHPSDVSKNPIPIGGGMRYSSKLFPACSVEDAMVRLVSIPCAEVRTKVVSASEREERLASCKSFMKYVRKMKAPRTGAR